MKFNLHAEIVEVNRYEFDVEAETREEAKIKLKGYLEVQCPNVHQSEPEYGIMCTDREAAWETRETVSIN